MSTLAVPPPASVTVTVCVSAAYGTCSEVTGSTAVMQLAAVADAKLSNSTR
jgi:hypothetical protein